MPEKTRSISIRVSESFLDKLKIHSERNKMPYTTYCRLAIAKAIRDDTPVTTVDEILLELKVMEPFLLVLAELIPKELASQTQKEAIQNFVERCLNRSEF